MTGPVLVSVSHESDFDMRLEKDSRPLPLQAWRSQDCQQYRLGDSLGTWYLERPKHAWVPPIGAESAWETPGVPLSGVYPYPGLQP